MKKLIYRPDGKLTNFAFWGTVLLIVSAIYFIGGGIMGLLQDKVSR